MRYYFTSDLHLGHENIIKLCNRPFKSLSEMEQSLIKNWNSRVREGDLVFHIGDFCFKTQASQKVLEYRKQLNGEIIFIRGNHDRNNSLKTCIESVRIHLGGKDLLLTHRPEDSTIGYDLCLVGHVHNHWKFKSIKIGKDQWDVCNVSTDAWSFQPITIEEILKAYTLWKKEKRMTLIEIREGEKCQERIKEYCDIK